jgi:hypothetical protein
MSHLWIKPRLDSLFPLTSLSPPSHLPPLTSLVTSSTEFKNKQPFPQHIQDSLVSFTESQGFITNSELVLAGGLFHQDVDYICSTIQWTKDYHDYEITLACTLD